MQSPNPSYNHATPNAPSPFHCPTLTKLRRVFHYRTQNNTRPMVKPLSRTHRNHQENIHRSGPLETGLYALVKNKVGYNFIETLNRTLNSLIENYENTFAMHAAMIFPHLLPCKTKFEIDGFLSKTIARRLKQW